MKHAPLLAVAATIAFGAQPLSAQGVVAPLPGGLTATISTPAPGLNVAAPSAEEGVDLFYAARAEAPVWLKDGVSRAAAAKLPAILRNATLGGLSNGPALAARVEAAIAAGDARDDKTISAAWVQYVRALRSPVEGVSFGDPALKPATPTAQAVLGEAVQAPSLSAYVDQLAAVNPLYSAVRDAALSQGMIDDPHVRATLDRLRLIPAKGRAIVVDAATQQMWMLEDGHPVDSMKVIVGKTTSPTPLLAGTIHYVTFNPYWHILDEVAQRKVAPVVIKRGVSYLKAARYETVSDWGPNSEPVDPASVDWKAVAAGTSTVHIRQLPGANNMMGAVKFWFENDFSIFLHDTPHKELFAKSKRNLSLGCVRLEHAARLAQWLLGRDGSAEGNAPEQNVQLEKGVPVFITYLTANVVNGQLAFADDVYGLDAKPVSVASAGLAQTGSTTVAH
jgi:L,D-transpeptidase YcbB